MTVGAAVIATPAAAAVSTHHTFDTGASDGVFVGSGAVRVVARDGGAVRAVTGVSGTAVAFPSRCSGRCPRAILEVPGADPGTAPLAYGAWVRLRAEQTTGGSNVMQKGTWSSPSQWKLQIDGHAGQPSCALMGTGSRRMYVVTAPVSVSDGRWHQVTCVRAGAALTVTVDGVRRASTAVPPELSVANGDPVRLGGNAVGPSADRYHGELDEVTISVG